jgi:hypothetical protein
LPVLARYGLWSFCFERDEKWCSCSRRRQSAAARTADLRAPQLSGGEDHAEGESRPNCRPGTFGGGGSGSLANSQSEASRRRIDLPARSSFSSKARPALMLIHRDRLYAKTAADAAKGLAIAHRGNESNRAEVRVEMRLVHRGGKRDCARHLDNDPNRRDSVTR